VNRNKKI
jgi:hypothetical protein